MPMHVSIYLSMDVSIYLSIDLSIYLSMDVSIHLSIYQGQQHGATHSHLAAQHFRALPSQQVRYSLVRAMGRARRWVSKGASGEAKGCQRGDMVHGVLVLGLGRVLVLVIVL